VVCFQSTARLSGVQRIALIGSILSDHPSPKDVDLVVCVVDGADLAPLASLSRRLEGRLQSQNRGADVFLADEGRHLPEPDLFLEGLPARGSCLMRRTALRASDVSA
jgi:hypothetical protein